MPKALRRSATIPFRTTPAHPCRCSPADGQAATSRGSGAQPRGRPWPLKPNGRGARLYDLVRSYLPELVYGANDGVVTTLAVVASVVGAELSAYIILILGFANLFADGVSMAASNVLSERSRPEPRPTLRRAARHGAATLLGFIAAGFVPLLAYLAPGVVDERRFALAIGLAGATLFGVGAARSFFSDRGFLRAGLEMLSIGAGAGAIAYAIGMLGNTIAGS